MQGDNQVATLARSPHLGHTGTKFHNHFGRANPWWPPEPAQLAPGRVEARPTAAGLDYRKPYALRHTFVSECIAAGIATFEIARMAGTSVLQIEKIYGHLLPDAIGLCRKRTQRWFTTGCEGSLTRPLRVYSLPISPFGNTPPGARRPRSVTPRRHSR